ncbi:kinase-like protein [Gigaspora margarita]|uniref:Kinase-like protein n=1 Tax=Gigaspora margarita TaxID=4874 RepID=A0A8H4ATS6_GIGMA|nr:kinase-like protein [Gigaspora margarita]
MMTRTSDEEWFNKAIIEKLINNYEYKEFTNYEKIGSGGFGTVFKHVWKANELPVALKRPNIGDNKLFSELKLLQQLHAHPNIISFYGVTKDDNGRYNIILEYADEGNLREYLKANFIKLQWTDKFRMAYEISCGLGFMHNHNIVHGDIHSKNILIHHGHIKIADFGLSKVIDEMSMTTSSICHGMLAYIEPKRFTTEGFEINKKSDTYSLGIILWEISSGRPPFQSFDLFQLIFHLIEGKRELPIEGTPSQYVELYEKCWDDDPTNRPEISSIRKILDKLNNDFENEGPSNKPKTNIQKNLREPIPSTFNNTTSAPLCLPDTLNSIDLLSSNTDSPIDNAKIKPRLKNLFLHIPILSQLIRFNKNNEIIESSLSSNNSRWHRWRKRIRKMLPYNMFFTLNINVNNFEQKK